MPARWTTIFAFAAILYVEKSKGASGLDKFRKIVIFSGIQTIGKVQAMGSTPPTTRIYK